MVHITLYRNSAERHRVDKGSFIYPIAKFMGLHREASSIINPSITFSVKDITFYEDIVANDTDVVTDTVENIVIHIQYDWIKANYAYIQEFDRYYYIDDIISISNGLWQISMSVDVLMSFKDEILALECFVGRNEFDYDNRLPDLKLPIIQGNDFKLVTKKPNYLKSFYEVGDTPMYVVQVANDNGDSVSSDHVISNNSTFNGVYILTSSAFCAFVTALVSETFWDNLKWLFENPTESLISFKAFPFDATVDLPTTRTNTIAVGQGDITLGLAIPQANRVGKNQPIRLYLGTISSGVIYSNRDYLFLTYEPYLNCQLYLPFYGWVDLDVNLYRNKDNDAIQVEVWYLVDICTGECCAVLRGDKGSQMVNFNISIDIPTGFSNKSDIARNLLLAGIKTAASLGSKALSLSADVEELNALESRRKPTTRRNTKLGAQIQNQQNKINQGIFDLAANSASDFTVGSIMASQAHLTGGVCSDSLVKTISIFTSYMEREEVPPLALLIKKPKINENFDSRKYAHMVGRPCQVVDRLINMHGYTEVCGVHMEDFPNALTSEVEEIETSLKSGVLLP